MVGVGVYHSGVSVYGTGKFLSSLVNIMLVNSLPTIVVCC